MVFFKLPGSEAVEMELEAEENVVEDLSDSTSSTVNEVMDESSLEWTLIKSLEVSPPKLLEVAPEALASALSSCFDWASNQLNRCLLAFTMRSYIFQVA